MTDDLKTTEARPGVKLIAWIFALFLAGCLIYFGFKQNVEFAGYAILTGVLFFSIMWLDRTYRFPVIALALSALWMMGHMLGGAVYIGSTRLYDFVFVRLYDGGGEFVILKYDQCVHYTTYVAFTMLFYFAMKRHMTGARMLLPLFAILAALGIGLLNEVVEFGMVVFAGAAEAVGGYDNTGLDMVFNTLGALTGAALAVFVVDKARSHREGHEGREERQRRTIADD